MLIINYRKNKLYRKVYTQNTLNGVAVKHIDVVIKMLTVFISPKL